MAGASPDIGTQIDQEMNAFAQRQNAAPQASTPATEAGAQIDQEMNAFAQRQNAAQPAAATQPPAGASPQHVMAGMGAPVLPDVRGMTPAQITAQPGGVAASVPPPAASPGVPPPIKPFDTNAPASAAVLQQRGLLLEQQKAALAQMQAGIEQDQALQKAGQLPPDRAASLPGRIAQYQAAAAVREQNRQIYNTGRGAFMGAAALRPPSQDPVIFPPSDEESNLAVQDKAWSGRPSWAKGYARAVPGTPMGDLQASRNFALAKVNGALPGLWQGYKDSVTAFQQDTAKLNDFLKTVDQKNLSPKNAQILQKQIAANKSNAAVLEQRRQTLLGLTKRADAMVNAAGENPLHSGMDYPEEHANRQGFGPVGDFFRSLIEPGVVQSDQVYDQTRRESMLSGQYPPPAPFPAWAKTPDQKNELIRQKNDLAQAVARLGPALRPDGSVDPRQAPPLQAGEGVGRTAYGYLLGANDPRFQADARTVQNATPWQHSILDRVRQQVGAEQQAIQKANYGAGYNISLATNLFAPVLGGAASGAVAGKLAPLLASRFGPVVSNLAEKGIVSPSTAQWVSRFIAGPLPRIAGGSAGGAAITAPLGTALGLQQGQSIPEAVKSGVKSIPSGMLLGGAGAGLAETIPAAREVVSNAWDDARSPALIARATRQAAKQFSLTPEEAAAYKQHLTDITQSARSSGDRITALGKLQSAASSGLPKGARFRTLEPFETSPPRPADQSAEASGPTDFGEVARTAAEERAQQAASGKGAKGPQYPEPRPPEELAELARQAAEERAQNAATSPGKGMEFPEPFKPGEAESIAQAAAEERGGKAPAGGTGGRRQSGATKSAPSATGVELPARGGTGATEQPAQGSPLQFQPEGEMPPRPTGPSVQIPEVGTVDLRATPPGQLAALANGLVQHPNLTEAHEPALAALQNHLAWHAARDAQYDAAQIPPEARNAAADHWNDLANPARQQYNVLNTAARNVGKTNTALGEKLNGAAQEVQDDWRYTLAHQAMDGNAQLQQPEAVPPPMVSTWRQLSPEEQQALPGAVRRALLVQDLANSAQSSDPDAPRFFTTPKLSDQKLEDVADQRFQQAQQALAANPPNFLAAQVGSGGAQVAGATDQANRTDQIGVGQPQAQAVGQTAAGTAAASNGGQIAAPQVAEPNLASQPATTLPAARTAAPQAAAPQGAPTVAGAQRGQESGAVASTGQVAPAQFGKVGRTGGKARPTATTAPESRLKENLKETLSSGEATAPTQPAATKPQVEKKPEGEIVVRGLVTGKETTLRPRKSAEPTSIEIGRKIGETQKQQAQHPANSPEHRMHGRMLKALAGDLARALKREQEAATPAVERRADTERRKRVSQMSLEEIRRELLTDKKFGVPNARAYEEAPREAWQVYLDADSMKWWNDAFKEEAGYAGGDALIQAMLASLAEVGLTPYRIQGDEIVVQGSDPADLKARLDAANDILREATVSFQTLDGRTRSFQGAEFSYGMAETSAGGNPLAAAEAALGHAKSAREAAGLRAAPGGGRPPGVVEVGAAGGQPAGQQELEGHPAEPGAHRADQGGARAEEREGPALELAHPNQSEPDANWIFSELGENDLKPGQTVRDRRNGELFELDRPAVNFRRGALVRTWSATKREWNPDEGQWQLTGDAELSEPDLLDNFDHARPRPAAAEEPVAAAKEETPPVAQSVATPAPATAPLPARAETPVQVSAAAPEGLVPGTERLVDALRQMLMEKGAKLPNISELNRIAGLYLPGSLAAGTYDTQDIYDALEAAVNLTIRDEYGEDLRRLITHNHPDVALDMLRGLLQKVPTQTARTEEKIELQQFSTPPTIAFVAAYVLNPKGEQSILEPSAGVGGLATMAKTLDPTTPIYANEIAPRRRALLELQGFHVTGADAERLNSTLPQEIRPTAIIMNPPFSATGGRTKRHSNEFGFRHLAEALHRLAPGGRLVAIMGRGASLDSAGARQFWWDTMSAYSVRANVRMPGSEYTKYGTSFDNQLIVIDKTGPTLGYTFPERVTSVDLTGEVKSLEELVEKINGSGIRNRAAVAEPVSRPEAGGVTTAGGSTSGARAERAGGAGRGQGVRAGGRGRGAGERPVSEPAAAPAGVQGAEPANQPAPAAPTAAAGGGARPDTHALAGVVEAPQARESEGYTPYVPTLKGNPHPGAIVETSAMSGVVAPRISYKPKLKVGPGISAVQMEPVSQAGQRHAIVLPDGMRAGYLTGDGTGVGKGRELAGIIADNWEHGRKRAVWVSVSKDLASQSRGDFEGIGYGHIPLMTTEKISGKEPITQTEGVIFVTYNGMQTPAKDGTYKGKQRWQQLNDWLGEDGVLILDEAHRLKNTTGKEYGGQAATGSSEESGSGGARAALSWQAVNPKMRVVYSSATAMTSVGDMGYMIRLGLWGKGTSFPGGFDEFSQEIGQGGVGMMEQVARDMKSLGLYQARFLDYSDVQYDEMIHSLTERDREVYNAAARAWQEIVKAIDQGIEITNRDKNAKALVLRQLWGTHQKFFKDLITAIKTPSIIKRTEQELAAGRSVILSLLKTGEAQQNRLVANAMANEIPLDELDFSPREMIVEFVKRAFPTQNYQEVYNPVTQQTTREPVLLPDGSPELNPRAVELQDRLIDHVSAIQLPENPLDAIISHFGAENVAEMTGRSKRREVVDGEVKLVNRKIEGGRQDQLALLEKQAFQDGRKRIAVISQKASTGVSLQSDLSEKNQQQRVHILWELPWSADLAMQIFGRSHRTNQASAPIYVLASSDIGGERRFSSTIAKRLASLGALTRGSRSAAGSGDTLAKYNYESDYGSSALKLLYNTLTGYGVKLPGWPEGQGTPEETLREMGVLRESKASGRGETISTDDSMNVTKFLNRILAIPIERQNPLFAAFDQAFQRTVEHAKLNGTFDDGLEDIKALAVRNVGEPRVVYTDPTSKAETVLHTLEIDKPQTTVKRSQLPEGGTFYRNNRSKALYYMMPAGVDYNKETHLSEGSFRQSGVADRNAGKVFESALKENYTEVPAAEAATEWDRNLAALPKVKTTTTHILTGTVLPIWRPIRAALQTGNKAVRVTPKNGKRLVGIAIPDNRLPFLERQLGLGAREFTPAMAFSTLFDDRKPLSLRGGLRLSARRIAGEMVADISGGSAAEMKALADEFPSGTFNFERRVWIPQTDEGRAMLARLLARYPVVQDVSRAQGKMEKPMLFPHKLYHGTRQKFEGWPQESTAQQWGRAVYFATNPAMPREEYGGDGGRVIEAYGDFQKPLYVPSPEYRAIVQQLESESEAREQELSGRADQGDRQAERELDRFVLFDSSEPEGGAAISERARKLGYDAIIAEHAEYGHEVAVLDTSRLRTPGQMRPARAQGVLENAPVYDAAAGKARFRDLIPQQSVVSPVRAGVSVYTPADLPVSAMPETVQRFLYEAAPRYASAISRIAQAGLTPAELARIEMVGYLLEPTPGIINLGLHVHKGGYHAVWINPFVVPPGGQTFRSYLHRSLHGHSLRVEDPEEAAYMTVLSVIHELAHIRTRQEMEPHWREMDRIWNNIGDATFDAAMADILTAITGAPNGSDFTARFREASAQFNATTRPGTGGQVPQGQLPAAGARPRAGHGGGGVSGHEGGTRSDLGEPEGLAARGEHEPTPAQKAEATRRFKRLRQIGRKATANAARGMRIGRIGRTYNEEQKRLRALPIPVRGQPPAAVTGGEPRRNLPVPTTPHDAEQGAANVWDFYQVAHGMEKAPEARPIMEALKTLRDAATRDFIHLPAGGSYAEVKNLLRRFRNMREIAGLSAQLDMLDVVKDLAKDPESYDLFNFALVARNLAAEVRRQQRVIDETGKGEIRIPELITPQDVADANQWLDETLPGFPKVEAALEKRAANLKQTTQAYFDAATRAVGVQPFQQLEDYFHQQVLEHAGESRRFTAGGRGTRVPVRGFTRHREGYTGLWNTNWIQSEFEVLSQMVADTMRYDLLHVVSRYSVTDAVKAEAAKRGLSDWRDAIPEQYRIYQPVPNSLFFRLATPAVRIANAEVAQMLSDAGVPSVLLVGARRQPMVLPEALAQTLDEFGDPGRNRVDAAVRRISHLIMKPWKAWEVLSPPRVVGFTLRKEIGELEVALVNMGTYREMGQAIKDVVGFATRKGRTKGVAPDLRDWMDRGGWHSLLASAEHIDQGSKLRILADFVADDRNIAQKTIDATWGRLRLGQDLREATTRYAMYRSYLAQMRASVDGLPNNFGASDPREIMAIPDLRDRAWKLADELGGAYGSQSAAVQYIADHGLAVFGNNPFFRFQSVNMSRFVRIVRNVPAEVALHRARKNAERGATAMGPGVMPIEALGDGINWLPAVRPPEGRPMGGGGIGPPAIPPQGPAGPAGADADEPPWYDPQTCTVVAARTLAATTGMSLRAILAMLEAGVGAYALYMAGRFILRAAWFHALMWGINYRYHPREVEDLPNYVRGMPVLILGRDAKGNVIYISRLSALEEVYSWIGLDNFPGYRQDYLNGHQTAGEIAYDMLVRKPWDRLTAGGPVQTAWELRTGKSFFPDSTNPRDIQDKAQYAFQSVGLGQLYDAIHHIPERPGSWLSSLAVHTAVKGEAAWDDTRALVRRFQTEHGHPPTGGLRNEAGAAIYNYKRSLQFHDARAATYWLGQYVLSGGTADGVARSLKGLDPMHGLTEEAKSQFFATLSPHDRDRVLEAMRFYGSVVAPQLDLTQPTAGTYVRQVDRMSNAIGSAVDRWAARNPDLRAGDRALLKQQREQEQATRKALTGAGLR